MTKKLLILLLTLFLYSNVWASQQVITSGDAGNALSSTDFYPIQGFGEGGTEIRNSTYLSSAGTLKNLRVELATAPDTGNSRTFTVNIDTVASTLACTISGTGKSCSDTDSISVSAGQYITIDPSETGTPVATATSQWSVVFDSTTTAESTYCGNSRAVDLSTTATQYLSFAGTKGINVGTTEFNFETLASTSGTFKNLYVLLETAPGSGATRTFTVREDNTNQTLTCAITGASATTCSDPTNSFTIAAGNSFTLMSEVSATAPALSEVRFAMTFLANTDGEFMFLNTMVGVNFNTTAIRYIPISDTGGYISSNEVNAQTLVNACTIKNGYVELSGAPGTGKSYTFMPRINAVNASDFLWQVAGTSATTANFIENITLVNDDNVDTKITPAGTPTAGTGRISYTGYIAPTVTRRTYLISEEEDEDSINKSNDFALCESCSGRGSMRNR